MPTILRVGGFRVAIYSSDHRPAHVHVVGRGGEAVFYLNCPKGPPALREVYGLSRSAVVYLRGVIAEELSILCVAWESMHGKA